MIDWNSDQPWRARTTTPGLLLEVKQIELAPELR